MFVFLSFSLYLPFFLCFSLSVSAFQFVPLSLSVSTLLSSSLSEHLHLFLRFSVYRSFLSLSFSGYLSFLSLSLFILLSFSLPLLSISFFLCVYLPLFLFFSLSLCLLSVFVSTLVSVFSISPCLCISFFISATSSLTSSRFQDRAGRTAWCENSFKTILKARCFVNGKRVMLYIRRNRMREIAKRVEGRRKGEGNERKRRRG